MPKFKPRKSLRKGKRRRSDDINRRKWLIRQLVRRDGVACRYCSRELSRKEITIDHVIPTSRGGLDDIHNMAIACERCNSEKGCSVALDLGCLAGVRK